MIPVKSLEITVVIDNYTDLLLPGSERVKRAKVAEKGSFLKAPVAEHGLSLVFNVDGDLFIMDFGLTDFGVSYNMDVLGINPESISFGVLSHGHFDHWGCLGSFLEKRNKPFKLYLHRDALLEKRYFQLPTGEKVYFPRIPIDDWKKMGLEPVLLEGHVELLNGKVIVSGEIPRKTDFEKGLPGAFYEKDGSVYKDEIKDDMAVYFVVDGKGLVVVSGCAHSGIINTILYGMELTGEKNLYAVLGGFHLTGPRMEEVIPKTVNKLVELDPDVISPMHCTGWRGEVEIEKRFPEKFIISSPGTVISL